MRACVEAGTDMMDIAGEPAFLRNSFARWDAAARKAEVGLVHACGFDALVADLGWLSLATHAEARGHPLTAVSSFLELAAGPEGVTFHATTLEALIRGLDAPRPPRPAVEARQEGTPSLRRISFYEARLGRWCIPLPSADPVVVRMSRARLSPTRDRPLPRYLAYFAFGRATALGKSVLMGSTILALSRHRIGQALLLRSPELFTLGAASRTGPSARQLAETSFTMTLFGHVDAVSPPVATLAIRGPEPGYVSTPILLVRSAQHWLAQPRDRRPKGVHTPATALDPGVLATAPRHNVTYEDP